VAVVGFGFEIGDDRMVLVILYVVTVIGVAVSGFGGICWYRGCL
jgi:hypothetical protein